MEVERQDKEAQAVEGRAFRLVTQLFTRWGTKHSARRMPLTPAGATPVRCAKLRTV